MTDSRVVGVYGQSLCTTQDWPYLPRIYKKGFDLRIHLREIGSRIRLKSGIYSIDPLLKLVMRMS